MEQLFQKQLLFTVEKKRQFYDSNPVQQTLRQEVQDLHLHIVTLEQENRKLKDLMSKNDG